jgi:hypothetical protein
VTRRRLAITVTCPCGGSGPLPARSDAWSCPDCGQGYRADGLDTADLARRLAAVKRYVWGGAAAICVLAGVLAVIRPAALLAVPVLLAAYFFFVQPRYRRKLRDLYESLPEWQLRPQ